MYYIYIIIKNNNIMETKNYELFQFDKTNRRISTALVNRLKKSINDIGFIKSRPIIVNKDFIIIDGQHRFEALKELNLPIIYEIENIDSKDAIIYLNTNQRVWRLEDYIVSYSNQNIKCYSELQNFEDKYKIGMSNAILIFNLNLKATQIRKGMLFEISNKKDDIYNFLISCKPYIDFYKTKSFVYAVCMLFKKANETDIEKVLDKIQIIKQQAKYTDYLIIFENIINRYKKSDENRIILTSYLNK